MDEYFDNAAPGLWYVYREPGHHGGRCIAKRLEDLPRARILAELEPLRSVICKAICDVHLKVFPEIAREWVGAYFIDIPSADEICTKIFNDIIDYELK